MGWQDSQSPIAASVSRFTAHAWALELARAAFGLNVRRRSQREKVPGDGASGYCVRNRIEAGGADCPSVSSGLAGPGESVIGGFLGGSKTVCGGCSLRAVLIFFFGGLEDTFGIFAGATIAGDSGAVPGNPAPWSGTFAVSNQRERLALRSSIAAHPPIPKLAERAIKTSATRARGRIDLAIVGVAVSIVTLGRARGWHRRVATLLIRAAGVRKWTRPPGLKARRNGGRRHPRRMSQWRGLRPPAYSGKHQGSAALGRPVWRSAQSFP
jgi:hypothetical protein